MVQLQVGFGYITVLENELIGQDIFVHHTAIGVNGRIYKYLVQGEYVSIEVAHSDNEKHIGNDKNNTEIMTTMEATVHQKAQESWQNNREKQDSFKNIRSNIKKETCYYYYEYLCYQHCCYYCYY